MFNLFEVIKPSDECIKDSKTLDNYDVTIDEKTRKLKYKKKEKASSSFIAKQSDAYKYISQ